MSPCKLLSALSLAVATASGFAQHGTPLSNGYVTALTADGGFAVQGDPIVTTPKTKFYSIRGGNKITMDHSEPLYLGQPVQVWGTLDEKKDLVRASHVRQFAPSEISVVGGGIIEVAEPRHDGSRTLRADGYRLRLTSATKMHYQAPATSLDSIGTNMWIQYEGIQAIDGQVDVAEAEVLPNEVSKAELERHAQEDFDPASVTAKERQTAAARMIVGVDYRKLPAHLDEDLQAKVKHIGDSLVPAYQRQLPEGDLTRINFRFQVVDAPTLRDAISLSNGIILVPYPAILRLKEDSQLAAVIADHIASILEKQAFLHAFVFRQLTALKWMSGADWLVPRVGIPADVVLGLQARALTKQEQQSGRVSLWLLKDAGYDIRRAPLAWWTLAPEKPEPLGHVLIPRRVSNLYQALGTTWRVEP